MKTKKIQHSGKEDDCIIICKECGKLSRMANYETHNITPSKFKTRIQRRM